LTKKYQIGDELTVNVEKIVPRGLGLAFAEELTVFVPLSAPGDGVRVSVHELKGRTAFAEIVELHEPSTHRVTPPCPYFGVCGGCDFMHLNYQAQLTAKVEMIRDCIVRIGKIDLQQEIRVIPSPNEFGYRLRAQWHADASMQAIGYYKRNSRELVDIEDCIVLVPELREELRRRRAEIAGGLATASQIDVAAGDNGEVSAYSSDPVEMTRELTVTAAGERFGFSARSFFQGNRFLIDALVEAAIGGHSGGIALDLYSGVGLFTLPLARRFEQVIGVEDNQHAVEFANDNAERAGLVNVDFYQASVRDFLASGESPMPDFVLLDPPRAGAEKDTIMNLIGLAPKRVSYVACEPSILARDLRRFVENGYAIETVTAIDLFPQTHHVETVVHLVKAGVEPPAIQEA
jgi:23S rRNA (uracil1939-C5)-methyltransferase